MREGWLGDDYLVFFSGSEISSATDKYGFETLLPGLEVLGLRGWDDLVVRDGAGKCFSIPTVPVDPRYLEVFKFRLLKTELEQDSRCLGKIKWYTKPVAFGGDPGVRENCGLVTHQEHLKLVRFWNEKYRQLNGRDVNR
jgi:hypothetical protein